MPVPVPIPPPDSFASEQEEEKKAEQRRNEFAEITAGMGLPTDGVTEAFLRQLLEQAGADMQNPAVINFLENYPYSDSDATNEEKRADVATAQGLVQQFLAAHPDYVNQAVVTPYSAALEESGFAQAGLSGDLISTQFATAQLAGVPASQFETGGKGPQVQPETGWMQYDNGVLVNKANPEPLSAVIYQPNSLAPGSPWWYDHIQQTWSPEQVATWRQRLADLGYLPREAADTKGFDEQFRSAIQTFHAYRYYNGGKAVAWDAAATQISPEFTPQDEKARIRNNTRQQFIASIGDEPSDAELESWTRYVIREATELQRRYMRRGMDESSALSQAVSVASEQAANKLWENPVASMQRENEAENTKLHDGLLRAIAATEGL